MGRKLKDVDVVLTDIDWEDARFSHPRMFELASGLAESGIKLLLFERNRHPYITTGKFVADGGLAKWVSADFCLINNKLERDKYYHVENEETKLIGWSELPKPTYYINNQRR